MPTRPDLRELAANVRDAFADCDRETLLDILTFVVKEYVAEGPPPMLMHQAETIAELSSMSFAQLVTALQTRLDLPELGLFAVDGEQVSVRVGGVMQPLQPGRGGITPPAAELPRPTAGVRVVEANVTQRPPAPAPAPAATAPLAPPSSAPPPSRGLSIRESGAPAPQPGPTASSPAPAPAPQAQPPSAAPKEEPAGGDDAAARFSLLELD